MAEWDGFEIRCTLAGTVGSNPTLSAIFHAVKYGRPDSIFSNAECAKGSWTYDFPTPYLHL